MQGKCISLVKCLLEVLLVHRLAKCHLWNKVRNIFEFFKKWQWEGRMSRNDSRNNHRWISPNSKVVPIWVFVEKICWPLIWRMRPAILAQEEENKILLNSRYFKSIAQSYCKVEWKKKYLLFSVGLIFYFLLILLCTFVSNL